MKEAHSAISGLTREPARGSINAAASPADWLGVGVSSVGHGRWRGARDVFPKGDLEGAARGVGGGRCVRGSLKQGALYVYM